MTQAVRRWTAGKGVDPRDIALLAYGGNGPLFAAIQAQDLGIRRVLVPKASPAFSALGALAALPTVDEERAYLRSASHGRPTSCARSGSSSTNAPSARSPPRASRAISSPRATR